MEAKYNHISNNQNSLGKPTQSISEYPATKPKPKVNELNKRFANVKNLNVLNTNTEEYPKVPSTQNASNQHLSNKIQSTNSQNSFENNSLELQKQKTEATGQSENNKPSMEQPITSTNDFNYNFESAQFSSLEDYNQNQNNPSNNFENLGVEQPNSQDDFKARNEQNFYLSNEDIANIVTDMNINMDQNINENFEINNQTNEEEAQKDEKNPFEYNEIITNELVDTNNQNNQFSTNEGEFNYSEYATTKKDNQTNQSNQPKLQLKENKELKSNIQTSSTTEMYNDYFKNDFNFNTESFQETNQFQNYVANNMEFNQMDTNDVKQEKKVETRDSSTQTQSQNSTVNLSPKISPFETKFQKINISQTVSNIGTNIPSKSSNFENNNKSEAQNQNIAFQEFIDTSSTPDSQNQNTGLEFADTYNYEMTSPYTTVSQVEHSEKKVENMPKKEEIPKSEPEFNFDNMPIETQDTYTIEEQNIKNENVPLSKDENNTTDDNLKYTFLESTENKGLDLAKIYSIAEKAILEDNDSSNIIPLQTKNQPSTDEKQKQADYSSYPKTENQISSLGTDLFTQYTTEPNKVVTTTTTTISKKELPKSSITTNITPLETGIFTQYTTQPTQTVKTTKKETTFSSNSVPFETDDFYAQYAKIPNQTTTTTSITETQKTSTSNINNYASIEPELLDQQSKEPIKNTTTTNITEINEPQTSNNNASFETDYFNNYTEYPIQNLKLNETPISSTTTNIAQKKSQNLVTYTAEPTKTITQTKINETQKSLDTNDFVGDVLKQYIAEQTKNVTTTKKEDQTPEIATSYDLLASELVEDYGTEQTKTVTTTTSTVNKSQKPSTKTDITPLETDFYKQFSSKPFTNVSTTITETNNAIPKETDYLKQFEAQATKTVTTTTTTEYPKSSISTSKSEQITKFATEPIQTINKNAANNSYQFEEDYLNLFTEPNKAVTQEAPIKTSNLQQITTQKNQTITTNLAPIETQNLLTYTTEPTKTATSTTTKNETHISTFTTNFAPIETKNLTTFTTEPSQPITTTNTPSLTINETIPSNIMTTTETQNQNSNFDFSSFFPSQPLKQTSFTDIFPLETQNQTVQPSTTLSQIQAPVTNILQTPITNISTNYTTQPTQSIQSQVPFVENLNTTIPTNFLPIETQTQTSYLPPIIQTGNIQSGWTQTAEASILPPNETIYTPQPTINITTPLPETQVQTIPTAIQNIPPLQAQLPNVYLPPVYQNNQTQYPIPQNDISNISTIESQTQNILIPPSIPAPTVYSPNPITNISTDIPLESQTQNILTPQTIPTVTTLTPNPITTTSTTVNSFEIQNQSLFNNTLPVSQNIINSTGNITTYGSSTGNNILNSFEVNPNTVNNQQYPLDINYAPQPQPQIQLQPQYSTYPVTQSSNINISNVQGIPGSSMIQNNYQTQTEIVPVEEIKYVPVKTVKYVKKTKVFAPVNNQVIAPTNNAASISTPLGTIPEYSSMSYQNPKPYNLPLASANLPYSSNTEYDNEMEDSAIPIYESNSSFQLGQSLNAFGASTRTIYNQSSVPNVGSSIAPPIGSSIIHTGRLYNPRTYLARSLSGKRRL